jgi:hypothetical protein
MNMPIAHKVIPSIAIKDQYGMIFHSAVATIFNLSKTFQETLRGNEDTGVYDERSKLTALSYEVNYYYDQNKQLEGYRHRPLAIDDEEGGYTRTLEVDFTLPAIININESLLTVEEKTFQAIEADLMHRSM